LERDILYLTLSSGVNPLEERYLPDISAVGNIARNGLRTKKQGPETGPLCYILAVIQNWSADTLTGAPGDTGGGFEAG
jgi:hypothetical protein